MYKTYPSIWVNFFAAADDTEKLRMILENGIYTFT